MSEHPKHAERRRVVRRVGMVLSALMVVLVLSVFALIVRTESAHDEKECPFAALSRRPFEGGEVREETRSCLPEVQERRYLVARPGREPYELARRRLPAASFAPARYRWLVEPAGEDGLVLRMELDGALLGEFHEEDAVAKPD